MIRLSERLDKIAGFIEQGERVADIGTDHGYIPMYLKMNGISDYVIAGDINEGPLEKMQENMDRLIPDDSDREGIFMRLGGGLDVVENGEVDTVVIAGMGGLLIADILGNDREKSCSIKKFILQPRNAQDKLRKWLLDNGYRITGEVLARESRFVWEIICVESPDNEAVSCAEQEYFGDNLIQYEVGQCLINGRDPLLEEFINNKIRIEKRIVENAGKSDSAEARQQQSEAADRIKMLEGILEHVNK